MLLLHPMQVASNPPTSISPFRPAKEAKKLFFRFHFSVSFKYFDLLLLSQTEHRSLQSIRTVGRMAQLQTKTRCFKAKCNGVTQGANPSYVRCKILYLIKQITTQRKHRIFYHGHWLALAIPILADLTSDHMAGR